MLILWSYLAIILVSKPYLRKGDDRLQGFALIEIILLMMAGNVFNKASGPDPLMEFILSFVLIISVLIFFFFFLISLADVLNKQLRKMQGKKMKKPKSVDKLKGEWLESQKIDRGELRRGRKIRLNSSENDEVKMERNVAYGDINARQSRITTVDEATTIMTAKEEAMMQKAEARRMAASRNENDSSASPLHSSANDSSSPVSSDARAASSVVSADTADSSAF